MQTEVSDRIIIKLQGTVVDTLAKINPKWDEHILCKRKQINPTLYTNDPKALYGKVDTIKLLYNNLVVFLGKIIRI